MSNERRYADALAALGHESRLAVFRLLLKAGAEGMKVGEISEVLSLHPSTLAHHLTALVKSNLVLQSRQGREIICRANYPQMDHLIAFLTEACCVGFQTDSETDGQTDGAHAETMAQP
ncbi:ArsR/SmtB family transcription factor [Rhodophyticola sp. SM2404]